MTRLAASDQQRIVMVLMERCDRCRSEHTSAVDEGRDEAADYWMVELQETRRIQHRIAEARRVDLVSFHDSQ